MTTSPTVTAPRGRHAAPRPVRAIGSRWWWIGGAAVLAVFAYVPLLAVRPGVVTPDTKTYLYLDPLRFLSQVAFMWDPTVGLGTVTHEYIGYLLPDGPVLRRLPPARRAGLGGPAAVARVHPLGGRASACCTCRASSACAGPGRRRPRWPTCSRPYFLQYAGRISVILLPWAGLPFMLGLTIVALRRGGWREPALFAVVVALVSGINASSIIYVGVAPDPLDPLRRGGPARVDLAPRPRHHAAHRHPDPRRLPVVDGGPRGGGGLRRQRPEVHRDRPLDVGHLEPGGHHPGPRLLVLLRLRPPGPLDDRGRPLHPGHLAPGDVVRRAGARPGGGGVRALARARLLPRAALRRAWSSRWGPSRSRTPPPSGACSSRS